MPVQLPAVINSQPAIHIFSNSAVPLLSPCHCGPHYCYLGDLYTESGQTLQSSFSAVSKPIFATKYSLESSRRDLQNALLCTALHFQFFPKNCQNFANFYRDFATFAKILQYFDEISLEFCRDLPGENAPASGSSWEFPRVFQDLQLSEIAPNLQFPELANNCARP